jgi:hypothetical protein
MKQAGPLRVYFWYSPEIKDGGEGKVRPLCLISALLISVIAQKPAY